MARPLYGGPTEGGTAGVIVDFLRRAVSTAICTIDANQRARDAEHGHKILTMPKRYTHLRAEDLA